MKRTRQLQQLSADHHHALVLARRLVRRAQDRTLDRTVAAYLRSEFDGALLPHFAVEEEILLPALDRLGEHAHAERTRADHAALRAHVEAAERGELARIVEFAALLEEHVRFEERVLFPACEARLSIAVLDEVARRAGRP